MAFRSRHIFNTCKREREEEKRRQKGRRERGEENRRKKGGRKRESEGA